MPPECFVLRKRVGRRAIESKKLIETELSVGNELRAQLCCRAAAVAAQIAPSPCAACRRERGVDRSRRRIRLVGVQRVRCANRTRARVGGCTHRPWLPDRSMQRRWLHCGASAARLLAAPPPIVTTQEQAPFERR